MYSGLLAAIPPTAKTFNDLVDWYLFFGVGASIVVISMLVYFIARFRDRGGDASPVQHKTEGWKIVALTVVISLSMLSTVEYQTFASFGNISIPTQCSQVPDTCVNIHLTAFQWGWNFTYPNGRFSVNNLTVPVDRIVVITITSRDVFHSFGIDMLAVKEDAIPGRVNQLWLNATQTGVFVDAIHCFELCGVGHAFMVGNLTVVSDGAWDAWMSK
jgi:cytochrome c oxidase subunit II